MGFEQTKIYVALLEEGTDCWRPVIAGRVAQDIYRILDAVPDGEVWQFQSGDVVRCEVRQLSEGKELVASELVPRFGSLSWVRNTTPE